MDRYEISGGRRLTGEIHVQGAKNSVLPILAATVLTADRCVIHKCPALSDTALTIRILRTLGCRADWRQGNIFVDSSDLSHLEISGSLTGKMRSSIVFLGPLLARCGQAIIAYPGGCRLGPRPIDLHLDGLRQMGATVQEEEQYLRCCAPEGLQGARIVLSFPSVGATENLMMAAVLAKGKTTLINCACEPEIVDLADFLIRCGAKIRGAGENTVEIEGVSRLHGCEHVVIGDRIAAATYLVAAAMTGGEVVVSGIEPENLMSMLAALQKTGGEVSWEKKRCRLKAPSRPKALPQVRTMPYPGFPTDGLPLFLSLAAVARGTSIFVENIFENRYSSVPCLQRMGASIRQEGKIAVVEGCGLLHGADVCAEDLRGGAGLVLAALAAQGTSRIEGIEWIERGYEHFCENLTALGAEIWKK